MRILGLVIATSCLLSIAGCATMSGVKEQYLVCSYDTVWETALETMKDRPITVRDKSRGLIETDWVETEGLQRSFGMFQREGFGGVERARMTLLVKRLDDVTSVSLAENREAWHRRGGVTQQATKWWAIEPSEEVMAAVLNRLNVKLKERGCHPV
ncbi:MAG: hypothetical protein ACREI9_02785 [Nitrospiraceae bacterium]